MFFDFSSSGSNGFDTWMFNMYSPISFNLASLIDNLISPLQASVISIWYLSLLSGTGHFVFIQVCITSPSGLYQVYFGFGAAKMLVLEARLSNHLKLHV